MMEPNTITKSEVARRILVVDDQQPAYLLVRSMLQRVMPNAEVDWALDYEEGLQSMREDTYDAYLVDYYLNGGVSGLDLIVEARKFNPHAPIIILTGEGTNQIDQQASELGAQDYLEKTQLSPENLERSIRYAIQQKRSERELQELYDKVHELEQLKTDMIRIASHDLTSPNTAILGLTEIMLGNRTDDLTDDQVDYVNSIRSSATRIQRIINDILDLERIEEMQASGENVLDSAALIHKVLQEQSDSAARQEIHLTSDVPNGSLMVLGNEALLHEAMSNLINNAIKYTPAGGRVVVRLTKEDDEWVTFTVQDNGIGIEEKYHDRLFDPFFRAKSKETKDIEGTGMGLHLVKNIVIRHHGEMIFESVYQQGSTFGFRLPLPHGDKLNHISGSVRVG